MSRPMQYDREEALGKAMLIFWQKGYHATSLKDLEKGLNMKPGSIYCAFSSKENLYLLALDLYVRRSVARFQAHMEQASSPLTGLAEHLRGFAREGIDDGARQVCMLTKTLVDVTSTAPDIAAQAKIHLMQIRQAFADAFASAKAAGELPVDADCMHLARRFQGAVTALRFELHLDTDQTDIAALAEDLAREVEAMRLSPPGTQLPLCAKHLAPSIRKE
ncbi:TetR/AcrR family transcriptional regulator [Pseudorhodobacter turbinis]|uniref:TetR/AcrR family transcriptional regulator n=1 Tax=Pseudorhodobacter turbinis TaxID=2500533 RepID=A0A4P8EDI5_9RHOB|nr:TetR/AcrR family transcriptional regulator [Pseudorhodobacter turbinis]QCO54753.1 TetR/AcrR family transcriptional regulator [Pseudorhodobacter turbinis]